MGQFPNLPSGLSAGFLLLMFVLVDNAHADFERGLFAYNHYEYQVAHQQFMLAALNAHPGACYFLGEIYDGGIGVPMDSGKAANWYRKAAELAHPQAQSRLAHLYQRGRGVRQDDDAAFSWYLRSAENGYPVAQYAVGLLYANGMGTKVNRHEAYKWLTVAASYGDPDAMTARVKLVGLMSPAQISRAQHAANDWELAWERR